MFRPAPRSLFVNPRTRTVLGGSPPTCQLLSANLDADGLFPKDKETPAQRQQRQRCDRLLAACFKCMPPAHSDIRFTLPALMLVSRPAALPGVPTAAENRRVDIRRIAADAAAR